MELDYTLIAKNKEVAFLIYLALYEDASDESKEHFLL